MSTDLRPRPAPDATVVVLDGEAVIHHAGRVHTLDPLATLVWRCCDGTASVAEIADDLADGFAADTATVRRDVDATVAELARLGLLAGSDVEPAFPSFTLEMLVDPPGSCAACAERTWEHRRAVTVPGRILAIGTNDARADAAIAAALAGNITLEPPPLAAEPPFLAVELHERVAGRGMQRLDLLLRGDTVVARSRRPDRILRALVAHVASYGDLDALGLVPLRGTVVGRDGKAVLIPEVKDPVRFAHDAAAHDLAVADQPVALFDAAVQELVIGAPGLAVDLAPIDAIAAADAPDEPAPLAWGRYALTALAVPAPATDLGAAALLTFGPDADDRRDHDAPLATICALVDEHLVVDSATPAAIATLLRDGVTVPEAPPDPAKRTGTLPAVQTSTLRNVARNALRPHYLPVMARKAMARLRPSHRDAAVRWAESVAESPSEFGTALDPVLWAEAAAWADAFRVAARAKLDGAGIPLAGGGHFQLVHFLVRYLQPKVVLETGVAAGYTSQAILTAMQANGQGELYSSDFPYFRLDEPERYVGFLVDEHLKSRWHLAVKGDRANLPALLAEVDAIDLVHYDSDKTVEGRQFVMDAIAPKLAPGAVIVMDDIDDNTFFRDWVQRTGRECHVFGGGRKYVGLVGL